MIKVAEGIAELRSPEMLEIIQVKLNDAEKWGMKYFIQSYWNHF